MSKRWFCLYGNCIVVRGAARAAICDLHLVRLQHVPLSVATLLDSGRAAEDSVNEASADPVVAAGIEVLLRRDYAFWTEEPERFPPIDLTWRHPSRITNAIIDFDGSYKHDYALLFRKLSEQGCVAVQIRGFSSIDANAWRLILEAASSLRFRHVDIVASFHPSLSYDTLTAWCLSFPVLIGVVIHSSPISIAYTLKPYDTTCIFTTQPITPHECGQVSKELFAVTTEHFTEARTFNSCLNRKLSVDASGLIRQCPSMPESFGYAAEVALLPVLNNHEFTEVWSLTKDHIDVCRDCEYRYVCTDCRAHLADPHKPTSKPARCQYDPYTATWGNKI